MNWRFWTWGRKPKPTWAKYTCERCGVAIGHWWSHEPCLSLGRPIEKPRLNQVTVVHHSGCPCPACSGKPESDVGGGMIMWVNEEDLPNRQCKCHKCSPEHTPLEAMTTHMGFMGIQRVFSDEVEETLFEITFPDGSVKVARSSDFWEVNASWWEDHIPFADEPPYTD